MKRHLWTVSFAKNGGSSSHWLTTKHKSLEEVARAAEQVFANRKTSFKYEGQIANVKGSK